MEQEAGPGELVGAGLGDDVDLAAGGAAVLGAVAVRGEAELADRLHPQRGAGGAAGGAVGEVVLQRAIEQVDVGARILTVDAHRQAVRHDRAVVAVRERVDRRQQLHQVGVVAAVDRDLLDGPLVGQVAELAGLRVHPRRAAHGDFLGGADLQRQRHRGALADGQPQPGLHQRPEPVERRAELVLAGRQRGGAEAAFAVGDHVARDTGLGLPDADADAGEPAALGILDDTNQRGRRLRNGGQRGETDEQDDRDESMGHGRAGAGGRVSSCYASASMFDAFAHTAGRGAANECGEIRGNRSEDHRRPITNVPLAAPRKQTARRGIFRRLGGPRSGTSVSSTPFFPEVACRSSPARARSSAATAACSTDPRLAAARPGRAAAAARAAAPRHRALRARGLRRARRAGDAGPGGARPRSRFVAGPRPASTSSSTPNASGSGWRCSSSRAPTWRRGSRRARRRSRRRRPRPARPHLPHRHARRLRHHRRHGDPGGDRA